MAVAVDTATCEIRSVSLAAADGSVDPHISIQVRSDFFGCKNPDIPYRKASTIQQNGAECWEVEMVCAFDSARCKVATLVNSDQCPCGDHCPDCDTGLSLPMVGCLFRTPHK